MDNIDIGTRHPGEEHEYTRYREEEKTEHTSPKSAISHFSDLVNDEVNLQLRNFFEQQKRSVLEKMDDLAEAFRHTADQLAKGDHATFSRYAATAAGKVESLSTSLRERDYEEIARATKDFVRRQPLLVLGGGVAVGFIAARLIKRSRLQAEYGISRSPEFGMKGAESAGREPTLH